MSWALGAVSAGRLKGCDQDLARTIRLALELSAVDFTVFETLRTPERQKELVARGVSRTLDSYHLPRGDGRSSAADVVPFIAGQIQWQVPACLDVARAMHRAAQQTHARVTWGAVWDRQLTQLDVTDLEGEVERYVARYKAAQHGKRPLIDYPHFQVPRT